MVDRYTRKKNEVLNFRNGIWQDQQILLRKDIKTKKRTVKIGSIIILMGLFVSVYANIDSVMVFKKSLDGFYSDHDEGISQIVISGDTICFINYSMSGINRVSVSTFYTYGDSIIPTQSLCIKAVENIVSGNRYKSNFLLNCTFSDLSMNFTSDTTIQCKYVGIPQLVTNLNDDSILVNEVTANNPFGYWHSTDTIYFMKECGYIQSVSKIDNYFNVSVQYDDYILNFSGIKDVTLKQKDFISFGQEIGIRTLKTETFALKVRNE